MYRAVVVDDEKYDLEGLRKLIPWDDLGIEVVCSENRPLAALSYIDLHPIDILVTDIKMPVLSGLELSRKAQEINPHLKTIFISGYQDFEYAKAALHLRADGYILKPVDDDEIVALLRQVVADLDEERRSRVKRTQLDESIALIKSDFLQRLLEGRVTQELLPEIMNHYPALRAIEGAHAIAAIIELDDVLWKSAQGAASGQTEASSVIREITSYVEFRGMGAWCELSASQIAFIYGGEAEQLEAALNDLSEHVRCETSYTVTSGYGEPALFPHDIPQSFNQAKELIGNKMFFGKNRIIPPGIGKLQIARDATDLNAILEAMFVAVAKYDLVKICDCMDELFDSVKTFEHPVKVYSFSIHIASKLETYLATVNETYESLLGWGFSHLDVVRQFETVEDIKSWLRKTLFEISERLFIKKQSKTRRLIEPIEKYIQEHMAEELTLREIANKFSYSANHMGYLFKDQTGESFNEYLVRIRMERARELLHDPQYKIYEVADLVGYKSLAYFSRLFREQYGISPGDYRKQS